MDASIRAARASGREVVGVVGRRAGGASQQEQRAAERAERLAAQGRALWARLHRFALAYDGDEAAARKWLAKFRERLPSGGCACRAGWDEAIQRTPVDLTDRESFWRSTWAIHNEINRKLGKDEMGEEEARRLWTVKPEQP